MALKRTPLGRDTPLRKVSEKRKQLVGWMWSTLSRVTPVKARNEKRIRERREAEYGDKAEWIRGLPCCVCATGAQRSRTVAAHCEKTRGAGGKAKHLIPLCADHEELFHSMGRDTFQRTYGVSLAFLTKHFDLVWRFGDAA